MSKELTPLEELKPQLETPLESLQVVREKTFGSYTKLDKELSIIETELKRLEKQDEILKIVKSFNCYTVEEIQGQWYLMMGTIVVKSPKIPISEETAMLLKEYFK